MLDREEYYDTHPAEDERQPRPEKATRPKTLYKSVLNASARMHLTILFFVAALLAMLVTVGSGINANQAYALTEAQQKADQLERENERLRVDIARLKSPQRIQTIATDQLHLVVPSQVYFSNEGKK